MDDEDEFDENASSNIIVKNNNILMTRIYKNHYKIEYSIENNNILTDIEIINFVKPYTSLSQERIQNVLDLVSSCIKNNILGNFIEIGVWKGGIIMAMALKCYQMGTIRKIHAYDTFTGMTTPGNVDIDINGTNAVDILHSVACICHLDEFKNNIELLKNINQAIPNNIIIHVGDITKINTKTDIPEEIALLRLDTDWYESTRFELEFFEPHVVDFGFVIVDDYGHWNGARKAVDEFKPPHINKIDYTGIWWQKDYGRGILELAVKNHPESETAQVLLANFHHFIGIYKAVEKKFWQGCGSYMFNGQQYIYQRETLKKQEALFNAGKNENVKRVLEIGVYLGHSLLILLCSNPNLIIDCIDIDGQFSPKAVEYLNKHFGNRVNFMLGSANEKIPELYKNMDTGYNLIHIDADHYVHAVIEQFNLIKPLAVCGGYIIFDDYEAVRECIDNWIKEGILEHIFTPWCLWTNIVTKLC